MYYDHVIKGYWIHNILFFVALASLIYWFISIFIFLVKKNYLSKYTSLIQRFWKRSLYLFWLIEVFLFFIYVFLIMNTPEENFYMLDSNRLNRSYLSELKDFFVKLIILFYFTIYLVFLLFFIKFSNKIKFIYLFIVLWFYLYSEFNQMYYLCNFFYNYTFIFDSDDKLWQFEWDVLKSRTQNYYVYILVLLKFWHTLYIYIYVIIFIWFSLNNVVSYNWLSALIQNFFFLYLFNLIFLYVWVKFFIKYNSMVEYYWFFININNNLTFIGLSKYFNLCYFCL